MLREGGTRGESNGIKAEECHEKEEPEVSKNIFYVFFLYITLYIFFTILIVF